MSGAALQLNLYRVEENEGGPFLTLDLNEIESIQYFGQRCTVTMQSGSTHNLTRTAGQQIEDAWNQWATHRDSRLQPQTARASGG